MFGGSKNGEWHTLALSLVVAAFTVVVAVTNGQSFAAETPSEIRKTYKNQPLFADDFGGGLGQWQVEQEGGGTVRTRSGMLDIDVAAGVTLWFRQELYGPVMIEYDALMVRSGGPNDWVSDLNCFWMATDPRRGAFFEPLRSGNFADYNTLLTYYVGQGGNRNTTTRFRRYIGDDRVRPLLPQNDLSSPDVLLQPNRWQHIRLIADGDKIQYYQDEKRLFDYV
ncbi:MAG: DUF6250 domain-containing protein, partial [Rhizomicrobium sp.]